MGRISKDELYAIKKVPTLGDTVIGTDAQNKDITVQFPVEAFGEGGDGSTIFNNNRFKKVEIGDAVTTSEVATLINNIAPTVEVLADEIVLFSSLRPPQKEGEISSLQLWALQGVGKGIYGVGGTITVLDSQPFIIDSGLTVGVFNPGDVINSELVDLGDFSSSTNLVDIKNDLISTINASSSTYVIESGTNWYFEGNVVGRGRVLYGWQGPNGTYGNGGSLANSNDLFLIIDEGSQEIEGPTGLESITEGGNQGWRLKFRDPQNYGDIGEGAIDFSKSSQQGSTNGATGEGSIAYGVNVKAPGFGSFVSGGNSEISGTFNSGFGDFLISNGYGSLITGFDNVENSQFGYNFTSGTGNRLGVSGGIGSGVLLKQGGGLATAVFGAANEEITYNAVGDYDRQPMIIVGNGTHTTPSGSSWVAIKRSNLLVGLRNGELILPSTSIARIDAEFTGRQVTTKEWVLSKISSGSIGGGIPDAPVDGESYVRKDGAWVTLDISATGIQSITAGTPNVSITDGGVGEKIISVTQTTAGLLSNVYFTAETITTSQGTFYKTLVNDKGSVPDTLTPNSVVLDDNEVGVFSSEFIGDPSPIENPITEGVYAAFPVIEVDSNQANQRIKIEVYICDNEGVPLDGGGEVGTLGSPTIVMADSGIVDIQAGNPTSVNCQGFIDFTQNPNTPTKILFGQRFRYVILAEKVGTSGGQVTFTLFSGSDYNSYYQIPTVGISTGLDPNAIHKNIANEFSAITEVTEPNEDSFLLIEDENGDKRKVRVGNVVTNPDLSTNPVENEYPDIATMLSDQSNQTESFFQFVLDDGTGEEAYYEKLSTSTSDISDYRKMSDDEIEVITNSNAWNLLRVESVDENTSTLNSVGGGRVRVEYDVSDDLVTSFLFNKKYSEAIVNVVPLISVNNIYIQAYSRNTKIIEVCKVSNSEVQGDYVRLFVEKSILSTNISLDDRLSFTFDLSEVSSGGATLTKDVNQVGHGFSVSECLYFDGTNYIKGNADSLTTSGVIGFVKTVTDADNFVLQYGGIMTQGTWVSGTDYFLSNVTDGLVSDEPTYSLGEVRVYVGQGVENGLLINIDIGQEITEQGGGGEITENPRLNLPANIYATQGVELNIYFDSIVFPCDKGLNSPANYKVEAICSIGKSDEKRFYINPILSDVGVYTLTFNVYSLSGELLENQDVNLSVMGIQSITAGLNALFLGDSLTDWGDFPQNFRDNEPVNTPIFWGTQGTSPNNHEGHGGWSTTTFLTDGVSPLMNNGVLDISNYRSVLGLTSNFDFVSFMLGVNDCFTDELSDTEINQIVNNYKLILDSFITDSPDARLFVQLPTIDSNTSDGWADNYGAVSSKVEYQKNIWKLRELMLNEFDSQNYNDNVLLGYAGITVDRYYGYPFTSQSVSNRITTQIERHSNAVHPSDEGFSQLGDGMFSMISSNLEAQAFGEELITNPNFTLNADGWDLIQSAWSSDFSGSVEMDRVTATQCRLRQNPISTISGNSYRLQYKIEEISDSIVGLRYYNGGSFVNLTTAQKQVGEHTIQYNTIGAASQFFFDIPSGNESVTFSKISIKEIL